MIINTVIRNEAVRNSKMISEYKNLISELPKGTLICRKQTYYYLKYREGNKVCDKYLGKDIEKIEKIKQALLLRKHYEAMLDELNDEKKMIEKIMEELS